MKKTILGCFVVMAALALSAATFAGTAGVHPVTILTQADGSINVSGALGDARASTDRTAEIGCSVQATATSVSLTCFARNSTGTVTCTTSNANLLQAASALTANASINFSVPYNGGECSALTLYTASWATPVQP